MKPRRLRSTALILAVAPLMTVGLPGAAHAALDVDLTKADSVGDVSTMTPNKQPDLVRDSVDIETVTYRIDRDAETLAITYQTPTTFTPDELADLKVAQWFTTIIVTGDRTFLVESTSRRNKVTTINNAGKTRTCKSGTSEADADTDTVTQTVPFSCLVPAKGGLMSGTLLTSGHGPLFRDAGAWQTHSYAF